MFKTIKSKIIFVTIFSIICLITTALLVMYQSIEIEEKDENIIEEVAIESVQKDVSGIDLKGKYDENDLKIVEKSVTQEKIEIRYFEISGLKDKTIQDKINKEIEIMALNCYKEKIKDLNEVINVHVSMNESANFANTISFELSYVAKVDDDGDGFYQGIKGINYDLNTGEEIELKEVFTSDIPIEDVLRKSTYYDLLSNRTEDNLSGELIVTNYGDIEDDIAEIINFYKKGKITNFSYTPRYVNMFYDDNQVISIDMKEFSEYIAIYNRYLNEESLFENDDIGIDNIYTLAKRYQGVYYYQNYQNEDNYYIDISIDFQSTEEDEFAKQIAQNKIDEIEKEIENVKQKVSENPNNFYILNYYIKIYTENELSTQQILTTCNESGNAYEMTVHDFEENIEPIIIDYSRQYENGILNDEVYNFSDILNLEPQNTIEYYNPETGEKIVI